MVERPVEIVSNDGRTRRFRNVGEAVKVLKYSSRTIRRKIEDGTSLTVSGYSVKVRWCNG